MFGRPNYKALWEAAEADLSQMIDLYAVEATNAHNAEQALRRMVADRDVDIEWLRKQVQEVTSEAVSEIRRLKGKVAELGQTIHQREQNIAERRKTIRHLHELRAQDKAERYATFNIVNHFPAGTELPPTAAVDTESFKNYYDGLYGYHFPPA